MPTPPPLPVHHPNSEETSRYEPDILQEAPVQNVHLSACDWDGAVGQLRVGCCMPLLYCNMPPKHSHDYEETSFFGREGNKTKPPGYTVPRFQQSERRMLWERRVVVELPHSQYWGQQGWNGRGKRLVANLGQHTCTLAFLFKMIAPNLKWCHLYRNK